MASARLCAPRGLAARFAIPDRIAGAAAPTALRARAASLMPATDAILETRSGVRNSDTADTILPGMGGSYERLGPWTRNARGADWRRKFLLRGGSMFGGAWCGIRTFTHCYQFFATIFLGHLRRTCMAVLGRAQA